MVHKGSGGKEKRGAEQKGRDTRLTHLPRTGARIQYQALSSSRNGSGDSRVSHEGSCGKKREEPKRSATTNSGDGGWGREVLIGMIKKKRRDRTKGTNVRG